jgi:hypothetical protein
MFQALQSKPPSRGAVMTLGVDNAESIGGRESVLTSKLMDDDDADVIVRLPA